MFLGHVMGTEGMENLAMAWKWKGREVEERLYGCEIYELCGGKVELLEKKRE